MISEIKDGTSKYLAEVIIKGMQEKKALDIVCLDLREVDGAVTDFFVVCHGDSTTQVTGIAKAVEEETLKELGEKAWRSEGKENSTWMLMDFVNVVAHVFHKDAREFYNIEALWGDAIARRIEEQV